MKVDTNIFDTLTAQAKQSPRLRMNLDMRTTSEDGSQRMLNALEPGTVLPIHRHLATSETVAILRGSARQFFYDENGCVDEVVTITAGSECPAMNVELGRWHRMESLESGTVILECKDGAYKPLCEEEFFINVLQKRIAALKEDDTMNCSTESQPFGPECVFRMFSGQVPLELIQEAMMEK